MKKERISPYDEEYFRASNKPYRGNQFSAMNWKQRMDEFGKSSDEPRLKTNKVLGAPMKVAITNLCYWLLLALTILQE